MKYGFLLFLFGLFSVASAIRCNLTNSCPEDSPCCNQYGECGTGAYCLGGCDIRYSYNISACMPMPRMSSFEENFKDISVIGKQEEYLCNASEYDWVYTGYIDSYDDALLLQMPNQSTGTVVSSTKYLWYGRIGATLKSSRDRGVITAFITFSDVQDEIDFEFLGYNLTAPQNNYYAQGILNYTNARNSSTSDTFENWHYYEIDWKEEELLWYVDGEKVRTVKKEDTWNTTTEEYNYPQTPSRIQLSLWPGGSNLNALGTIEWAGGAINWDSEDIQKYGYYYAYFKNLTVEAYDLPDFVQHRSNTSISKYHAFLYNSTKGFEENIFLTDRKTWLGSGDATGFDPQNEEEDKVETTKIVSLSGSHVVTKTTVKTKNTSGVTVKVPTALSSTTTTEEWTGGFVQNSKSTSAAGNSSGSGKSSSGAMRGYTAGSIVAGAIAAGVGMFVFAL